MPPGFPARLQANADRLGRARNHVRSSFGISLIR
jgi:hypothetical protein